MRIQKEEKEERKAVVADDGMSISTQWGNETLKKSVAMYLHKQNNINNETGNNAYAHIKTNKKIKNKRAWAQLRTLIKIKIRSKYDIFLWPTQLLNYLRVLKITDMMQHIKVSNAHKSRYTYILQAQEKTASIQEIQAAREVTM